MKQAILLENQINTFLRLLRPVMLKKVLKKLNECEQKDLKNYKLMLVRTKQKLNHYCYTYYFNGLYLWKRLFVSLDRFPSHTKGIFYLRYFNSRAPPSLLPSLGRNRRSYCEPHAKISLGARFMRVDDDILGSQFTFCLKIKPL